MSAIFRNVKFGNKVWYVLKETPEKILLAGDTWEKNYVWQVDFSHNITSEGEYIRLFEYKNCEEFFNSVHIYLNEMYYNSSFSEEDKKHIITVENKYPVIRETEDEQGTKKNTFTMESKEDRIFPLKYEDVRDFDTHQLGCFQYGYWFKESTLLLPPVSDIDERQPIPAIERWWDERRDEGEKEHSISTSYTYDEMVDLSCARGLRYYYVVPCVWVDAETNLEEFKK